MNKFAEAFARAEATGKHVYARTDYTKPAATFSFKEPKEHIGPRFAQTLAPEERLLPNWAASNVPTKDPQIIRDLLTYDLRDTVNKGMDEPIPKSAHPLGFYSRVDRPGYPRKVTQRFAITDSLDKFHHNQRDKIIAKEDERLAAISHAPASTLYPVDPILDNLAAFFLAWARERRVFLRAQAEIRDTLLVQTLEVFRDEEN